MAREADTHIRVSQETWRELNVRKGPGDSFEDVISDLLDRNEELEERLENLEAAEGNGNEEESVSTDGGSDVVAIAD